MHASNIGRYSTKTWAPPLCNMIVNTHGSFSSFQVLSSLMWLMLAGFALNTKWAALLYALCAIVWYNLFFKGVGKVYRCNSTTDRSVIMCCVLCRGIDPMQYAYLSCNLNISSGYTAALSKVFVTN